MDKRQSYVVHQGDRECGIEAANTETKAEQQIHVFQGHSREVAMPEDDG